MFSRFPSIFSARRRNWASSSFQSFSQTFVLRLWPGIFVLYNVSWLAVSQTLKGFPQILVDLSTTAVIGNPIAKKCWVCGNGGFRVPHNGWLKLIRNAATSSILGAVDGSVGRSCLKMNLICSWVSLTSTDAVNFHPPRCSVSRKISDYEIEWNYWNWF